MVGNLRSLHQHARLLPCLRTTRGQRLFAAKPAPVLQTSREHQQVILLPWFGAREKDVLKYAACICYTGRKQRKLVTFIHCRATYFRYRALWEHQGVATHNIEILHPTILDILIPSRLDAFVEHSKVLLYDRAAYPVVIHSFSNGGFILLTLLLASDLKTGLRLSSKVQQIVLDSAPAPVNPDMTARALLTVLYDCLDPVASPLFLPLRFLCGVYLRIPLIKQRQDELWRFWLSQAPVRPILCLLSKTDPLIDAHAANRFLDAQEARGCEVHRKTWESTHHVQHYREDPEGYVQALDDFNESTQST